jgi:O-antigen/teichoic acid export membrane protein
MLRQIKSLFTQTAIYGIGNILARGISFLLVPLLTNAISPAEFGKLGVVQTFIGLAEVFFMCGMRQSILRYSPDERYSREKAFSAGLFWIALSCLLWFTVLKLLAGPLNAAIGLNAPAVYDYMLVILILDAIAIAPYTYLQSAQKPVRFVALKVLHVTIYFGGCIYFVVFRKQADVEAVMIANIWASLTLVALGLPIIFANLRRDVPGHLLKRMLQFGLPYIPNIIFVVIIDLIGRILIARFLDLDAAGYYNAASKMAMLMFLVVYAFQIAWQPFFLSHLKDSRAPALFARVFTYYGFVTTCLFLVLGLFYREIAALSVGGYSLIGESYRQGLYVIPVILLAYIFCGAYSNFIVGIYAKEKTYYVPFITFAGAVLNIAANVLLLPRIGIMGAAVATLLSYAVMAVILYPVSRRLFAVPYEWTRIIKLALAGAAVFWAAQMPGHAGLRLLIMLGFVPLLFVLRFFEKDELEKFRLIVRGPRP